MNALQKCLYEYRTANGNFPTYQELVAFNDVVIFEGIERGIKLGLYLLESQSSFVMSAYLVLVREINKDNLPDTVQEKNNLLLHLEKYRNGSLNFPRYYELVEYASIIEYYGIIKGLEVVESQYLTHENFLKVKNLKLLVLKKMHK